MLILCSHYFTGEYNSIPVDDDEGYATTDDELDLDVEEKIAASAAPTRSAAVPVAKQAKKAAVGAAARKKVIGQFEEANRIVENELLLSTSRRVAIMTRALVVGRK